MMANDAKGACEFAGKRLLFVHQGAELYGSDRTFAQSVRGIRRAMPASHITVLLAAHGPLEDLLKAFADEIIISPLFVLRKHLLKKGALFDIPFLFRAIRRAIAFSSRYDAVYINTAVIVDFVAACRIRKIPSVLHVHELPTGFSRIVLKTIVRLSGAAVIFNSHATREAFGIEEDARHLVVSNGTEVMNRAPLREDGSLRILLIGRFNSWKGQGLLVSALARLEESRRKKIRVVMAGGVYGEQHHFKEDVIRHARESGLMDIIDFKDFVPDTTGLYHWANLIVVPSLLPEPFGLVAIEAMGHGRAVIAACHGGLCDIVVDGKTGTFFAPGDPDALAAAVVGYLDHPDLLRVHGEAGRRRFSEFYHEDHYMTAVSEVVQSVIGN